MALSESSRRRHALSLVRRRIRAGANKAELERYAAELGVEPRGTGSDGAVTKDDLIRALTGQPSPQEPNQSEDHVEELTDG